MNEFIFKMYIFEIAKFKTKSRILTGNRSLPVMFCIVYYTSSPREMQPFPFLFNLINDW